MPMRVFTFLTFSLFSFCAYAQNGAIGIGTESPNAKSILEIYSTDKGLLIPRLTEAQRNNLQAVGTTNASINGLLIFNATSNKFNVWNLDKWEELNTGAGIAGPAGPAGAQWYNGTLNPPSTATEPAASREGDLYLNNNTGGVYKRQSNGTWLSIANLTTGIVGPAGPQGATGAQGLKGDQGNVGATGPQGATGATGPIGPIGLTGPAGPQGASGPQGAPGVQGVKGDPGDVGVAGPAGPSGVQGPQGDVGPTGAQGAVGPTGLTGPAGPQGIDGAPGPTGLTGPTGAQGPQGEAGPIGAQGPAGATGPAGPQGLRGLQGEAGEQGPAGQQGPSGSTTGWLRTGNGIGKQGGTTNPGVNNDFLGTSDEVELIIAANRTEAIRVGIDGKVKIGTTGTFITSVSKVSLSADLPSIPAKASLKRNFPLANVALTASVAVSSSIELPDGLMIAYARVISIGTVEVKFINVSEGAIDLPSATFHISAVN